MRRKRQSRFPQWEGWQGALARSAVVIVLAVLLALAVIWTGADQWGIDTPPQTEDSP
jgi:hypothetical protein